MLLVYGFVPGVWVGGLDGSAGSFARVRVGRGATESTLAVLFARPPRPPLPERPIDGDNGGRCTPLPPLGREGDFSVDD